MTQEQIARLEAYLPGAFTEEELRIERGSLLSSLTTFRLGGLADYLLCPSSVDAFCRLIAFLREEKIRYMILGNGSNVLFADEGFRGVVVCMKNLNKITPTGSGIRAQAGVPVTYLASRACEMELSGLEFLYGIPGSVGGALYMDAGAYGGEVSQIIESALCYDAENGQLVTLLDYECDLGYRHSRFMDEDLIVLEASFRGKPGNKDEIRAVMNDLMQRRTDKQPLEYPSAGSTFKRYPGRYTAQMIDQAGLKGYSIGGAQVSEKHAGFLINRGGATSEDMLRLIGHVKKVIKEKEGIDIECEVEIIPASAPED